MRIRLGRTCALFVLLALWIPLALLAGPARVGGDIAVHESMPGYQTTPKSSQAVAVDQNGNFIVVWSSYTQDAGGTWGVYAQRFNADGTPAGGEFRVNTTIAGDQQYATVAMMNAKITFITTPAEIIAIRSGTLCAI